MGIKITSKVAEFTSKPAKLASKVAEFTSKTTNELPFYSICLESYV